MNTQKQHRTQEYYDFEFSIFPFTSFYPQSLKGNITTIYFHLSIFFIKNDLYLTKSCTYHLRAKMVLFTEYFLCTGSTL